MPCKQNPIPILYLKEAPSEGTGGQGDDVLCKNSLLESDMKTCSR